MRSVLAELLVARGCAVEFVTPAVKVAGWCDSTLIQGATMRRLLDLVGTEHLLKAPKRIKAGGGHAGLHPDRATVAA